MKAKRPHDRQLPNDVSADLGGLDAESVMEHVERRKLAHELRTPFAVILSRVEALLDDNIAVSSEEHRMAYLDEIRLAAHHALEVVEAVTTDSDTAANQETDATDLYETVHQAYTLMQAQADDAGVKLSLAPFKEHISVRIKPSSLRQMLLNILVNAIKFTPSGGEVGIALSIADDTCTILVNDNGIGIAPAELERIRQARPGRGYGYAITNLLATLYDAKLSVESRRNHGTTVSVTLSRSID